jgi:nucleotide-binding universal stress UspA family protein
VLRGGIVIRSILVPLDGSPFAEFAVPLAQALAGRTGARIRLVSVHEPRADITPGLDAATVEAESLEIRSATQAYLADTAARLQTGAHGEIVTELVDGVPGPAVVSAVERHRPDLIVMSTHGRGPMSRFWLGSVADHLIRHVEVPVLLARPVGDRPGPPEIRRILAAVDLSTESAAILDVAAEVARGLSASVTILHVVEPIVGIVDGALPFPIPVDSNVLEARKAEATKQLEALVGSFAARGVAVESRVVVGVGAAATILSEVAKRDYDLVALTTHGAGGVRRLLVGSVADKVIRGSERPVLVLRSSERPVATRP